MKNQEIHLTFSGPSTPLITSLLSFLILHSLNMGVSGLS